MKMPALDVHSILQTIKREGQGLNLDDDESHGALLASARALVAALEPPAETIVRIAYERLTEAATYACIDLKVFNALVEHNGEPKTAHQLAATTNSDPELLERLLKHLATGRIVTETGAGIYEPNRVTQLLSTPPGQGIIRHTHDLFTPLTVDFPGFLEKTAYRNPVDKDAPLFKYAFKTDQLYFDYMFSPGREKLASAFSKHMEFKTLGKKWYEVVPVDQIFSDFKADDKDAVLLVDIGGDTGLDALNFHKTWPKLPGRIVLQDLPEAIEKLDKKALEPVESMGYDFFTPQPIKGAKAYCLKMVLHNWSDESCQKVLANIKLAMEKGYSRILINEPLIQDQHADWFSTSMDLIMMMVFSSHERTARGWKALIEAVEGLKVVKIWNCEGVPEKLIEVELV